MTFEDFKAQLLLCGFERQRRWSSTEAEDWSRQEEPIIALSVSTLNQNSLITVSGFTAGEESVTSKHRGYASAMNAIIETLGAGARS